MADQDWFPVNIHSEARVPRMPMQYAIIDANGLKRAIGGLLIINTRP
jgi:hypothetical protein